MPVTFPKQAAVYPLHLTSVTSTQLHLPEFN